MEMPLRGSQGSFSAIDRDKGKTPARRSKHRFDLETTRRDASGPDLETLDRRIEASWQLLEWIEQALELQPAASPAVRQPPHQLISIQFRRRPRIGAR
jgi:hypothetical protein